MKIVLISGKARHGKDTVAGIIEQSVKERGERVLVTHYADLVKYICKSFFGWDGKKDERGRHILQYVGTDVVRKQNPTFWLDFLVSVLKFFDGEWDYVIIPDTRFKNEVFGMIDAGFDVTHLRVVRNNVEDGLTPEQRMHQSEIDLDDVEPDAFIYNNGTIFDLNITVEDILEEYVYER